MRGPTDHKLVDWPDRGCASPNVCFAPLFGYFIAILCFVTERNKAGQTRGQNGVSVAKRAAVA